MEFMRLSNFLCKTLLAIFAYKFTEISSAFYVGYKRYFQLLFEKDLIEIDKNALMTLYKFEHYASFGT